MPLSPELAAEVANALGIANAAVVQKDYSVVEVLGAVLRASGPDGARLVFSGGTCLAKAHRLTLRMSEDIDLKVVVPGAEGLSRNQLRTSLGRVKDAVEASLTGSGFVLREPPVARNDNRKVEFLLVHEGGLGGSRVMRPGVKLELFHVPLRGPSNPSPPPRRPEHSVRDSRQRWSSALRCLLPRPWRRFVRWGSCFTWASRAVPASGFSPPA